MKIEFIDLAAQYKELNREIKQALERVIKAKDFIFGQDMHAFEKEFAHFCQSRYAVGVSSGTDAIFLSLLSLGIGPGDEVLVPAFTYIATAFAVSYTGAKPVFVDIDKDTYNIDPQKIRKAITSKTRAIIPVHLFGQPADMPAILNAAYANNLKVIEDAAQAHGASIKMKDGRWQMAGSIADTGCFSFYPTKNLGAMGDAGMIVTNNGAIYKKLLLLRDYGRVSRYEHSQLGYNARLDTIQAAILRVKLKKLKIWNEMRKSSVHYYDKLLRDIKGVTIPYTPAGIKHVFHVYAIRTKKRDELWKRFKSNDIGTIIYYPIPLHLQKAYRHLGYKKGDFPVAEEVCSQIISLPIHPYLKQAQVKFIARLIKQTQES